ncbi:MAG: peptidase [Pseudomonadota bacterium]
MTYCLGIKVRDGLVCLSDGRITSGVEVRAARKFSLHGPESARLCLMTSGLRSLRDKVLAYFDRAARAQTSGYPSLLDAVQVYTRCLRQVQDEDRAALEESKLSFNLHTLITGQLPEDGEPRIFLVYPEGNWIEVGQRTPYLSIGATAYGKPILDRALKYDTPLETALKIAYLSFDSTRYSSADVGFPVDLLTFGAKDRRWRHGNYDYDELLQQRTWWNERLTASAREMPPGPWSDDLLPGSGRLSLVGED